MHDGCTGSFENGKQVVNKLRAMGFSENPMPLPQIIKCEECEKEIEMVTFEFKCPHCNMVYGVTPCHSMNPNSIQAAGIDY